MTIIYLKVMFIVFAFCAFSVYKFSHFAEQGRQTYTRYYGTYIIL